MAAGQNRAELEERRPTSRWRGTLPALTPQQGREPVILRGNHHAESLGACACVRKRRKNSYTYRVEFEWDPKKEAKNLRKHKVSFSEAATVFGDTLSTAVSDPDHSLEEDRYITIGMSDRHRLLIVAHTEWGERIRIISARELTRAEREAYEEETYK